MPSPKLTTAFAFAMACQTLLAPGFAQAQAKANLRIAAFLPLSGPLAPYGQQMLQGMNLALAETKATDPDLAKRVTLVTKDTQKPGLDIERLARDASVNDKADLFIGTLISSTTFMLATAADTLKKPMISPVATDNFLTAKSEMVYRAVYKDSDQGDVLAQYTLKNLSKTAAAVLIPTGSDSATAIANQFEKSFVAGGGNVVGRFEYTPGAPGLRRVLDKVYASKPQVIISPGFYQDVGRIMDEASAMGLRYPILGGDGWDSPQLYKLTTKNGVRGHFFVTPFSLDDPEASTAQFISSFKREYQHDPDMLSALSYDAMLIALNALKRSNSRLPDALARAIGTTKDLPGALGPISINVNRDAVRPAVILKTTAEGNKFAAKLAPAAPAM